MHKPARSTPVTGTVENLNSPPGRFQAKQPISQPEEKSDQSWHAPSAPPTLPSEESASPTSAVTPLNGRVDRAALANEQAQETTSDTVRGRPLGQILIILVVAVLLVNVPIGYRRASLVQSVSDATPVVIYDGMVLKGNGPERYILENHKLRQFSGPDTFNYFRKRYALAVHMVADDLLTQFEPGQPVRRLVTCQDWPYIYALENGQKHRLNALPFSNQDSPWDSIGQVTCNRLRDIPTSTLGHK